MVYILNKCHIPTRLHGHNTPIWVAGYDIISLVYYLSYIFTRRVEAIYILYTIYLYIDYYY